jgi:hypothetical protein
MYEARDNAMQNESLNRLETHFPGVRCSVVTSQVTRKNIWRISFVDGRSHTATPRAGCRCIIFHRVRCAHACEVQRAADFLVSALVVMPETIFGLRKLTTSRRTCLAVATSEMPLKIDALIAVTNQFYERNRPQLRSRVAITKAMKTATTAAAISIQFCACIPKIVK